MLARLMHLIATHLVRAMRTEMMAIDRNRKSLRLRICRHCLKIWRQLR